MKSQNDLNKTSILSYAKNCMATTLTIKGEVSDVISESDLQKIEETVNLSFSFCDQLENELTEFKNESPVYKLNHSKRNEWIYVTEHFLKLYQECIFFHRLTDGAFDPGFRGEVSIPFEYRYEVDEKESRIRRKDHAFHIGFGAIGKGYAVDLLSDFLKKSIFSTIPFSIDFGGSSLFFSEKTFHSKLSAIGWGVEKDEKSEIIGVEIRPKRASEKFIGVSGILEKGQHIKNTRTHENSQGQKNDEKCISVFTSASSALFCDAISTSLFILSANREYSIKSAEENQVSFVMMNEKRVPFWNQIFLNHWEADFLRFQV